MMNDEETPMMETVKVMPSIVDKACTIGAMLNNYEALESQEASDIMLKVINLLVEDIEKDVNPLEKPHPVLRLMPKDPGEKPL